MGLAGPEILLINLRKTLKFDQKPEEGVLDGTKVWILHGTWRTRQGLVGPDSRPANPMGALPPYIPMDATLYLGKDDHWPYKLVLVGHKPTTLLDIAPRGPRRQAHRLQELDGERSFPRRIELVYSNVKLNADDQARRVCLPGARRCSRSMTAPRATSRCSTRRFRTKSSARRTRPPRRKGRSSISRSKFLPRRIAASRPSNPAFPGCYNATSSYSSTGLDLPLLSADTGLTIDQLPIGARRAPRESMNQAVPPNPARSKRSSWPAST